MRKLPFAVGVLIGLSLLGACQSADNPQLEYAQQIALEPAPGSKEAETEALQKATALAQGPLAWELVRISDVQRDAKSVTWVATTRTLHAHCTADPDASGAYCTTD
jgi:hypothetical protein